MSVTASKLAQMMKTLTEEDYSAVIKYVEFLISSRKQTTKATIQQIQEMFTDNKGWNSEEEMLKVLQVLGLDRSDHTSQNTIQTYERYGICGMDQFPYLAFDCVIKK